MRAPTLIVRVVLTVNFALFVLTFIPAFSGVGRPEPGVANKLWGNYRVGGWRADVVWVVASTVLMLLFPMKPMDNDPGAKVTRAASRLWLACFFVYLGYTVMHMFG